MQRQACLCVFGVDSDEKKGNLLLKIRCEKNSRKSAAALECFVASFSPEACSLSCLADSVHDPSDPRFVGAWWLGFIILGTALLLASIPTFFFPKYMEGYFLENHKSTDNELEVDKDKSSSVEQVTS